MSEHVDAWLTAYVDGELYGRQLRHVEAHLAECAHCRAELETLQALSSLLQESPAAKPVTSPDRFVAQVGLQLPRRSEHRTGRATFEAGWQLAPLGLLVVWACLQGVFLISRGLLIIIGLGLGQDVMTTLLPIVPAPSANGPGDVLRVVLSALSSATLLQVTVFLFVGLLACSWLASWWVRQQRQSSKM